MQRPPSWKVHQESISCLLEETGCAKALRWREKGAVAESAREVGEVSSCPAQWLTSR